MRVLFFIYIIAYSFFPLNLDSIPLLAVPPVQIYVGDLMTGMAIVMVFKGVHSWRSRLVSRFELPYLFFLGWVVLAILAGIGTYGYRAFGESRTVVHFFTFLFPFALFDEQGVRDLSKVVDTVEKVILLSALLSLTMFFVAPFLEFVQEDFRGERYLNSNQTFFLVLASCWLFVRILNRLNFRPIFGTAAFLFLVAAILSKNRTAIASLAFVLPILIFVSGRLRVILASALLMVAAGLAFAWFAPGTVGEVSIALGGILNPTDDPNYSWRLQVQSAALEQGMDTFWSGQGYGSYFNYIVADAQGLHIEEVTPHNQFLTLFLKTGVIGVLSIVVAMGWFLRESYRIRRISKEPLMVKTVLTVMMLATASQFFYGFAYDFQAFFGIYLGFGTIIIREVHRELLERPTIPVQANSSSFPIDKPERSSLEQ